MNYEGFKMLRGFGDGLTNRRTFVNVESLSRLKNKTNSQSQKLLQVIVLMQYLKNNPIWNHYSQSNNVFPYISHQTVFQNFSP